MDKASALSAKGPGFTTRVHNRVKAILLFQENEIFTKIIDFMIESMVALVLNYPRAIIWAITMVYMVLELM